MNDSETPTFSGAAVPEADASRSALLAPLGLTGPSWQEQDGVLRDLWMQNKTPQEIAALLSRSVAAIMTRAARLGLPRRSAPGRKAGSRRVASGNGARSLPPPVTGSRAGTPRQTSRVASEGAAPQSSPRICLMCLRSFQSMGRHNRICPACKSSGEYAAATSMADIHFPV